MSSDAGSSARDRALSLLRRGARGLLAASALVVLGLGLGGCRSFRGDWQPARVDPGTQRLLSHPALAGVPGYPTPDYGEPGFTGITLVRFVIGSRGAGDQTREQPPPPPVEGEVPGADR